MDRENLYQFMLALVVPILVFLVVGQDMAEAKKMIKLSMTHTPFNGPSPSSIPVTSYNSTNFQIEVKRFLFGQIYVFDDPITETPSPNSKLIGRAQSTYTFVSQQEIMVSYVSYTVSIHSGMYNDWTLNVQGASPVNKAIKLYSIVGGTGAFQFARGMIAEKIVSLFGPMNASAILSHQAIMYM
ncbi:hypothetical protein O6H91_02G105000 [Diphasiastrum complanatum]|uniref:Uncharacterized protein n=1 Tax=Diphasiastrum complanatum TaxID=34168 RepID=A0ACC2EJ88_DIPCM|nr:hypothetical protein O6H91_02G105000 [Diphasiastrum complanatum]